jgi:hypothetical protein
MKRSVYLVRVIRARSVAVPSYHPGGLVDAQVLELAEVIGPTRRMDHRERDSVLDLVVRIQGGQADEPVPTQKVLSVLFVLEAESLRAAFETDVARAVIVNAEASPDDDVWQSRAVEPPLGSNEALVSVEAVFSH